MKKKRNKKTKNRVYVALLHGPVYNKNKQIVTTSITGFDLHDIARSARTYGISGYYVVNPLPAQRKFAKRIIDCWGGNKSFEFNPTRAEAFAALKLVSDLEDVAKDIKKRTGKAPIAVATSANAKNGIKFEDLSRKIKKEKTPYLIVFGTGWGLTKEAIQGCNLILEPIVGRSAYRHLSVRSAAAIVLDRLFGKR